jgi:membrane protease YdiL (CAAX protease family)
MSPFDSLPSFWNTVRLLLGTAQKRAAGRRRRQQELMNNRAGKSTTDWSGLAFTFAILLMAVVNVLAAFAVQVAVESAQRVEATAQGKIIVSQEFLDAVNRLLATQYTWGPHRITLPDYASEARQITKRTGGSPTEIESRLIDSIALHGEKDFLSEESAVSGIKKLSKSGRLAGFAGSVFLSLWFAMLVFQGEGLELDIQRRRHPMWEWLFSHPIPSGAIFLAEMLTPIAANPIYWTGPLFAGVLYGLAYDPLTGMAAAVLIGIPITIAAACLGKALEIGVTLRFSPRSRGGLVGLMSWMGYASMMLFFAGFYIIPRAVPVLARFLEILTILPWPWLGFFLGTQSDGSFFFLSGMIACWAASALTIAAAVWFSVWGTQRGLTGSFAKADAGPSASRKSPPRFGREPLYRKEFLWFIRDRSAIVQTILIPLTIAGYQAFNLRFVMVHAQEAWNYLCGAAILFGTYFLWVLGPKSLSSEGAALWIAMTWPRGLESLLKAKAWLWSFISSGLVALILLYACFVFPKEIWKIALVGVAWYFFGRSMAEKSVTLVTITSESGEIQKIPAGRRWAAQLGMLTFSIGVLTQQWHIAVMGIVYSQITAAAMWQNFRARLPYLYDPWSETFPPPPTLMHAMISISILIEAGAILTSLLLLVAGRENIAISQAISYGICALAVSYGVSEFLNNREVSPDHIWCWQPAGGVRPESQSFLQRYGFLDAGFLPSMLAGAGGGLLLGLFGRAYLDVLEHLPVTAEILHKSQLQMATLPGLRISYFVMAVFFAPFAEEYLFRGLLFRALDREWGGWRAVAGSAAFFAIYHPALAWLPVGLLGVANALLFKKTGKLAPAIVLHMVYNAVVLSSIGH